MKLKGNLKLKNLYYMIQGYYKAFISREHARLFDHKSVQELIHQAAEKAPCVKLGYCQDCECPIEELLFSDKRCKLDKCPTYVRRKSPKSTINLMQHPVYQSDAYPLGI